MTFGVCRSHTAFIPWLSNAATSLCGVRPRPRSFLPVLHDFQTPHTFTWYMWHGSEFTMKDFWHKNVLKSNCPQMHRTPGLQLLTPARSASQRPRSTSWSQVFVYLFVLFPLKQQRKNENTTRDDGQGSTHVLGFRRTCCYGNAGCAPPEVRRQHARSTQSRGYSIASSGRCMRARQPGAWAPQLCTQGPPFTRVLPPPPRGEGRGPGGRLRCLASRAGFQALKTSAPPAGCPQRGSQRSVSVS